MNDSAAGIICGCLAGMVVFLAYIFWELTSIADSLAALAAEQSRPVGHGPTKKES